MKKKISQEKVVLRDHRTYVIEGGCDGMHGQRILDKEGKEVDEEVTFYAGFGWQTQSEIMAARSSAKKS